MATYNITTGSGSASYTVSTGARGPAGTCGSGSGTVTTISFPLTNGIVGVVTNPTTTPSVALTLYDIVPESVNGVVFSGSSAPTLAITGTSSISGTNTGDQDLSGYVLKVTPTDLNGGTTLAVNGVYFDSFTAGRTLTFSGTPVNGNSIELTFDASVQVTIIIPTSYRLGDTGTTASITFPAGNHIVKWTRRDSRWYVADSAWETTADVTAPTISSATLGSDGTTLTIVFDESVTIATGAGFTVDASVTGSAIAATYDSGTGTTHTWTIADTIDSGEVVSLLYTTVADDVEDIAGNDLATIDGAGFTVTNNSTQGLDVAAPTLSSVSPADGATDIAIGANIVATFSETVFLEDFGTITIVDISTPANTVSLTIPDAQVTVSGSAVTINLSSDLDPSTAYAVNISADCVRDAANNFFAGITGNTTWNFTTVASDVTAPTLSSATIGTNGTTLTLVFSETVAVGAGGNGGFNVDASTGGSDVTATYASGSGSNTLVTELVPSVPLTCRTHM